MTETEEKIEAITKLLNKGMVTIKLDGRQPGVSVPRGLSELNNVILNISRKFDPPDLELNDWGIRCTLSFSGVRFRCAIPWFALYEVWSSAANVALRWSSPGEPPVVGPSLFKHRGLKLVN